jgi:putative FmdB family regulatory protein
LALGVCECQEDDVPTYQYACTACGHRLEAVQSFADEPLTVCPACEGRLRKLFSSVGVVFKGSGFYRTDSRNDAKGSTSAAPAKDGANGNGASSTSTTTKSESTSTSSSPKSGSKSDSKPAAAAASS